jgi:very-short-patch-repair endonuclease
LTEAVVIADMALQAGLVEHDRFQSWARDRVQGPGAAKVRRVAEHAEPKSESPMETRLRMLLVLAGLPRPVAQVSVQDARGRFLGRPDLYYPDHRLGIEYDGAIHRDSLAADNRRQNRLLNDGISLLRFTAADVLHNQAAVVAQVRAQLSSSGRR